MFDCGNLSGIFSKECASTLNIFPFIFSNSSFPSFFFLYQNVSLLKKNDNEVRTNKRKNSFVCSFDNVNPDIWDYFSCIQSERSISSCHFLLPRRFISTADSILLITQMHIIALFLLFIRK